MSIEQQTMKVGFWSGNGDDNHEYPDVDESINETKIEDKFLDQLKLVEKYSYRQVYMGYSECRVCDKEDNGDSDFTTHDMSFIFPDGYRHYIEEHNIHPPENFYDYVMKFTEPTPLEFANLIFLMVEDILELETVLRNKNEYPEQYQTVIAEIPKLISQWQLNNTAKFNDGMGALSYSN
jgi:hypothetical protein